MPSRPFRDRAKSRCDFCGPMWRTSRKRRARSRLKGESGCVGEFLQR
jgi:hypothetical protein